MDKTVYLNYWAQTYKEDMLTNIMPFWLKNGLDKEFGGVYTCLTRSGQSSVFFAASSHSWRFSILL